MAGFKFFLDGVQVDEPEGFRDFEEQIVRDDQQRIIRYDFPLTLTFVGTAYEAIENKYQEAYNSELALTVIDARTNIETIFLKGIIKMSNCTFNLSKPPLRSVECEVDDNIYQNVIFNNLKRPIVVSGNETLNGLPLTPITPVDLTVFIVGTGANVGTPRTSYDIRDCFEYAISFVSDNQVSFASSWYDSLPDDERLVILAGAELRDPTLTIVGPEITLQIIFDELWRKYNLYMIVENPITNPTIRLEQESYLYGSSTALVLDDIRGLTRSMDFEKLYNRISIGSTIAIRELGTNFLMYYVPFLSFVEEQYNIGGVINVDRELDLVSDWIIDHNSIANAIENNVDTNDDEIFIIQYDQATSVATKGQYFPEESPSNRFYNEQLLNSNVAQRFNYLGEIVLNSGLLTASFQAEQTVPIIAANNLLSEEVFTFIYDNSAFPFNNDSTPPNFDTDNNYNNSTYTFTAPVTGFYRFRWDLGFQIVSMSAEAQAQFAPVLQFVKNGTDTITPSQYRVATFDGVTIGPFGIFQDNTAQDNFGSGFIGVNVVPGFGRYLRAEQTILMETGDTMTGRLVLRVRMFNNIDPPPLSFAVQLSDSIFANPTTPISGGVFVETDPDEYYVGVYKIEELGLTDDQWESLTHNVNGIIRVNTGYNDNRISYIRNAKRNVITGKTEMEMIFNRKQSIT